MTVFIVKSHVVESRVAFVFEGNVPRVPKWDVVETADLKKRKRRTPRLRTKTFSMHHHDLK